MLTVQYALTKDDYNNYYTFVTWDAPGRQRKRSLYYLRQIGTIILFTAVFFYTGLFDRSSIFAFIVISFILLTSVISITGVRSSIMQQAKKISDDPENTSIFAPAIVTISETGIFLQDEFTERKYQWQAFIKKQENSEYYFLFYSSLEAIIIPKRVFKTTEQILFKSLLAQFLSFDAEVGHLIKT
jgi:YcxB-like protein